MHARQVECLRAAVGCAQFLGPVLGAMWYPVLVTLQQAEELLYQSQRAQAPDAAGGGSGDSSLSDLQVVRGDCVRLLAFTRVSGADSIAWALRAMCVLGADLSSAPVAAHVAPADEAAMRGMPGVIHRRLSAALSRPTFAIEQLHAFAVRNIGLLVGAEPDSEQAGGAAAWQLVVQHLLETAAHSAAPPAIRTHAGAAAADIVLAAMGVVAQTPEAADDGAGADGAHFAALVRSGDAQVRALAPLLQMMAARSLDVCRLTLDTVHRLLQASGRWIQGAWGVVFDVIHCVFAGAPADARQPGLLVRCAFPCLQLICSDYLEDLPPHCLRRCVESMALFGRQTEDLNIALTAIGQAWALCDFLQGAKAIGGEPPQAEQASTALAGGKTAAGIADGWWAEELAGLGSPRTRQVLWVLLLRSLADLGRDRRHEVRLGAIQTLFRTLEMHGASFDAWMWDGALWVAVLPLAADALAERARVFGLIQSGQLADLADPQDAAEMASKSGVVVEDPARLHRRQWDETAATALQGAVRIWAAHPAAWGVGHADQAWQLAWVLTHAFLVGDPGPASVLPDTQCALELDTPTGLVDEPVPADASLRTRDSTVTAIDCAAALVSGGGDGDAADAMRWRVGWRAWLAMGAGVCRVPDGAALALNTDSQGSVVVTQDALCAYLQLCPALVRRLRAARWFSEADCSALLAVVRLALSFVDAPLSGADDAAPTKLQALALDSVMLVAAANDETQPAGDPRLVDLATATVLAISELALLAAAPYALRAEAPPLGEFAVVRRAAAAFSPVARRLDALQGLGGRRPPRPTLVAVGAAALDRLGDLLSAPELPDSVLALALRRGVWQDAAVAMGLHLVAPLARRSSSWFVGVVPLAMPRLRDVVGDGGDGRAALAAAWDAAGAVLAAALDGPGLPTGAQIALLDTVAAASLRYVATGGQEQQQPAEVAAYWATLVRIVERAAEPTAEPCVLLGADNGGPDNGAADQESEAPGGACGPQALAMAGCRWLFAMSAQTSQGAAVPAWVSAAAVPAMVRRCRAVVDVYADERALVGRSPMPQAQAALVLLVLQGLAQLECQPGALLLQQPQSDRAGSGAARQVLGGGAAHVFAMYESLLGLLTVPDAAILGAVQRCLRRVSAELFG
ncbi:Endocytosis and vacuole integrity protein [Coemansia nantahalensis]|nr:Endocytosis and vacuole integrity protein [Coemansia nantahalensis]